jgi:hypothetical protein
MNMNAVAFKKNRSRSKTPLDKRAKLSVFTCLQAFAPIGKAMVTFSVFPTPSCNAQIAITPSGDFVFSILSDCEC